MICSVYRPSRRKHGKSVKRRLYWGQYRVDGTRDITRVPLHTNDKQVARERLSKLVRNIQQAGEGLIASEPMRDAMSRSLGELGSLYTANLEDRGRDDHYVKVSGDRIRRLERECGWKHVKDVEPVSFQKWRAALPLSAKTVNDYLATMRGFIRWLMKQNLAAFDPLKNVERVEARGRRVRQRRAFTVDEVARLLQAAPLDRRRFYLTAYYTGLRRAELMALEWGDIQADDQKPFIRARAATTKNREEARIAIRPELLAELRAMRPGNAAANDPVFENVMDVAGGHKLRRFRRDLKSAGIEYKDAQGRIADFHALSRVTPNTHMGQRGVGERVRQEFMRHSDLRLTSSVYTDAEKLPTMEAILALPSFSTECAQRGSQSSGSGSPGGSQSVSDDWVI